jgi:glycosyltransferase involved in cell wall biosynthesis
MKLPDITPLILTWNEEANIGRVLEKLSWATSVVVLDSGSTDSTEKISRSHANVRWHRRAFDSHSGQWNAGLALIPTPWVLSLDADYLISRELVEEIAALPAEPEAAGFRIPFIYQIRGQSLRQSLLPPRIALFRKNRGFYLQDGHTQDLLLEGSCGTLLNPIFHDDRKPFARWWASQEKYADLEVGKLLDTPWEKLRIQDRLRKMIFPAPLAVLFFTLIFRCAILDGKAGWIYAGQRFLAETLLAFKLLTGWFKA